MKKSVYQINAGSVLIGGNADVSIQTMWKLPLNAGTDISGICLELETLKKAGCGIIRFAVPDLNSAAVIGRIAEASPMPLVADIHFDYLIALKCLDYPVAKLRINPGNIGAEWKVAEIVKKAADRSVPIRIGVNGGSLPVKLREEKNRAAALVSAAADEINILQKYGFNSIVVSLKSSDINDTEQANRLFRKDFSYPLHLGLTEAGPLIPGIVKSAVVINRLLEDGIGETVRISLSDSCMNEVYCAKEILKISGKRKEGVNIISCPRCGRASFDTHAFIRELEPYLNNISKNISVAVMGCTVNGPEEAKNADIGITGKGKNAVIFSKGKEIIKTDNEHAFSVFIREIEAIINEK